MLGAKRCLESTETLCEMKWGTDQIHIITMVSRNEHEKVFRNRNPVPQNIIKK